MIARISLVTRVRLATAISVFAAGILVAGPARLRGQWADHCQHHFGRTHTELIAALMVGVLAFFLGYDYENNRLRVGPVIGGVVAAGAVLTYFVVVGRGCGT